MTKKYNATKWIAVTALLTALVITTSAIPPLPVGVGRIYWCDCMILIAAFLSDPISALIAGGVGTLLYDVIGGSAAMALVSLVIHGGQGFLASFFLHKVFPEKHEGVWATVAGIIGAIVVIGGYFLQRAFIAGGEKSGVAYALSKMPANFIQEAVGIAIAVVICYAMRLKSLLIKNNLLPQTALKSKKEESKE